MAIPEFSNLHQLPAKDLLLRIADRVRLERRRLNLNQVQFAAACEISLRTFKRFEMGECDSVIVFIKIIIYFERVAGFELLFPAKPVDVKIRTPIAALNRFMENKNNE